MHATGLRTRRLGACLLVAIVGLPLTLTTTGCSAGNNAATDIEPTSTPTATVSNGACLLRRPAVESRRAADGLVTATPPPTAVTALWTPGLNQRPCGAAIAHYGATDAARLAADIRHAPPFPKGEVNCPNDDGSAVELYFAQTGRARREYVAVGLTGCATVAAPGRAARTATTQLLGDLAALAPQPWAAELQRRTK